MAATASFAFDQWLTTQWIPGWNLEISILGMLLQRHEAGHGKAKYMQRMRMVYRACQKDQWLTNVQEFPTKIVQLRHAISKNEGKQPLLSGLLDTLKTKWPIIESRIVHASQAMWPEISRGFFLPLMTLAVATLARLRSLLHLLGQRVSAEVVTWKKIDAKDRAVVTLLLQTEYALKNVVDGENDEDQAQDVKQNLYAQTLQILGLSGSRVQQPMADQIPTDDKKNDAEEISMPSTEAEVATDIGKAIVEGNPLSKEEELSTLPAPRRPRSLFPFGPSVEVERKRASQSSTIQEPPTKKKKKGKKKEKRDAADDFFDELFG